MSAYTTPFTFGERLGIVFIVETACLSAVAVASLLVYIGYSAVKIKRGASRNWSIASHIHYYFLNLMMFDLVQAIGGILNIKWVVQAIVTDGTLCTVQGVLKNAGDVGVALTSLTIALHTFCVLVFRWESRPSTALVITVLIWIAVILNVGISFATHKGEVYYGDTQYWCWITSRFPKQRIFQEYFWLWLAAFCNIIIYVFLALVIKGFVEISGYKLRMPNSEERETRRRLSASRASKEKAGGTIALQLLFYPAVYVITVLPIAIVRFTAFSGYNVPFPATAFSDILFSSSGLLNVLLYTFTRPKLLPSRSITLPPSFDTPLHIFTGSTTHRTSMREQERLRHESLDIWIEAPRPSFAGPEKSPAMGSGPSPSPLDSYE